jgi:tRNA (cmo5U34)-methyltransferase
LLGAQWDHETLAASMEVANGGAGWQTFLDEKWNIYWWPDEMDRPSPLFEQLCWLSSAGFDPVDCFWLRGAHAIYGGYVPGGAVVTNLVGFEPALATGRSILGMEI